MVSQEWQQEKRCSDHKIGTNDDTPDILTTFVDREEFEQLLAGTRDVRSVRMTAKEASQCAVCYACTDVVRVTSVVLHSSPMTPHISSWIEAVSHVCVE